MFNLAILLVIDTCYYGDGHTYNGEMSVTENGYTCQRWDTDYPHIKIGGQRDAENYPSGTLEKENNYCRNPEDDGYKPWCFTTNVFKRWDYCAVPKCTSEYKKKSRHAYKINAHITNILKKEALKA